VAAVVIEVKFHTSTRLYRYNAFFLNPSLRIKSFAMPFQPLLE
jgi:hypothetical protein